MPVTIPASQARPLFTQALVGRFSDNIVVPGFLRSFFPSVVKPTRYLSIEVSRGTEKIAADVVRGSDGNRNTISRSTEKIIDPPYYDEFCDITELDHYYRLFGTGSIDSVAYAELLDMLAEKLAMCRAKIERAYEKQCADVLQTGIITLVDGTQINYGRKALSLVDLTGTPWTTGATDVYAQMEVGAQFIRQVGKAQGGTVNVIMGTEAFAALRKNTTFITANNLFNLRLDAISGPQRNALGGILHGEISLNSFRALIWTYPDVYENAGGTLVPYIDPKKITILPENTDFRMGFAAVPQLIDELNPTLVTGEFVYNDFRDPKKKTHEYHVESAGVAIPGKIDQAWTAQVVA